MQQSNYFIKNYSDRLRSDGFTVANILEDYNNIPVFNGVKPDIYAKEGDLERIIVVKTEEEYSLAKEDIESLKEYSKSHYYSSFWGFIVTDENWQLVENII